MSTGLEQVVTTDGWDRVEVQENGQVTIPKDLREKHGIEARDSVVVGENPEGDLCIVKP